MEVPGIHIFSKQIKRHSSLSKLTNKSRPLLDTNHLQSLIEKRQYNLNPFVASTLNDLGRYKIEDFALWNCRKCSHDHKLTEVQSELNRTFGYTFSHNSGIRTASYRSGNPQYPCLIHDPQPMRVMPVQQRINMYRQTVTRNNDLSECSTIKNNAFSKLSYWQDQNIDPEITNPRDKHHLYRDIQTTETLNNKGLNVHKLKDNEFKRKLKRLIQEADECQFNMLKFSSSESKVIQMAPLLQLKEENMKSRQEYLSGIKHIIDKAESGEYHQKPKQQSYFQ